MQAMIEFFTGMRFTDALLVIAGLLVFFAYAFICASQLLKHEIDVFRGLIDPEDYEEDGDFPDDEDSEMFQLWSDNESWQ